MLAIHPVRIALGSAAILPLLLGTHAALAHHSFAMFDANKEVTVEGTVKNFSWANPHVWIDVLVPNDKGEPQQWGLEAQNLGELYRRGWTAGSLKPGDKIAVQIHPMKDGSHGGQVMKATFADGRPIGTALAR